MVTILPPGLGFVTAPGNPLGIRHFADLTRNDVRFLNRQAGSGTRLLLDYHLAAAGIPAEEIRGYDLVVFTHMEVGLAVLAGEADAGIATEAISTLLGLDFQPIVRERFDMICDKTVFFQKGVQALIKTLSEEGFRRRVAKLRTTTFKRGRILLPA